MFNDMTCIPQSYNYMFTSTSVVIRNPHVNMYFNTDVTSKSQNKVNEKSRECHNHNLQPMSDTKGKLKRHTHKNTQKTAHAR